MIGCRDIAGPMDGNDKAWELGLKEGSVVSWKGASKELYGEVFVKDGMWMVDVDGTHTFPLRDLGGEVTKTRFGK